MEDSDQESDISADSLQNEPGELTDKVVSKCLSNRGYSADGTELVYLDLCLENKHLTNVALLENYRFIQNLDLSNNKLRDVSVISTLKYLLNLNASNNQLETLPCLEGPFNLLSADFSCNHISDISRIGRVPSLLTLNLDSNQVTTIHGLDGCSSLKELSLSHNSIAVITGLDQLPLQTLRLSHNALRRITGLEELGKLQSLHLAHNSLRSLRGLAPKMVLSELRLEGNDIIDLLEVRQLQTIPLLRRLTLSGNPLTSLPDYRAHLLFYLRHLSHLDEKNVLPEEKVAAVNRFEPPLEVIAAQNHVLHVVKSLVHPVHVRASVLSDPGTVYPVLVLTGPHGSAKNELARRLVAQSGHTFRLIKLYSTKKVSNMDKSLIPVSRDEFEEMTSAGQFIASYEVGSVSYAVSGDQIEAAAAEGVASVICCELEGVLSLKRTAYQPRVVLLSPMDAVRHEERLRSRERYTEPQISLSLKRTEMYNKYHSDNHGAFDLAINSSDIEAAFGKLSQLVEYYSGQRSGVGPGQSEVINPGGPELSFRQWSCGSLSSFEAQAHFPNKESVVKSAVRGVTHPVTPAQRAASQSSSSYVYPETGDGLSGLSHTEFSSSTELSATARSLVQLRSVAVPPLTHRTM